MRMPAQWHPHERCIMAFSAAFGRRSKRQIERIRREQAQIAQAIARFEPVSMLANPADLETARALCGPSVDIVELEHYDIWTRDTLPSVALDDRRQPVAVNWNFNVWGEKFAGYDADRDLARRFAQHRGLRSEQAGIVTEGGAFELDGAGTLITTETSLLNPNRNPGLSKREIESEFQRLTGARKVIWLHGSEADDITDGHVDGLARFVAPGIVLVEISDDPYDPEYADLIENARRLEGQTDARGRRLDIVRLKRPHWETLAHHNMDFAASYLNSYFPNGGVVMPVFGDPAGDREARETFQRLMPDREIVQLSLDGICEGGGGIHCSTQQIPAIWGAVSDGDGP